MIELMQRDYWRRLWVVQEIFLAREAVIACGPYRAGLLELRRVYSSILGLKRQFEGEVFDESYFLNLTNTARGSLKELIIKHANAKCQDPRDRIYALRSLALDITDVDLMPDYSKLSTDLYWDVLQTCTGDVSDRGAFQFRFIQILGLTLNTIYQDFQARTSSNGSADFLARKCGSLSGSESTFVSSELYERQIDVHRGRPLGSGSMMQFSTDSGGRWITLAVVEQGDQLVPFGPFPPGNRLAAVINRHAGNEHGIASFAILEQATRDFEKGRRHLKVLERMHDICPHFEMQQYSDALEFTAFPKPWVIFPSIIMAMLLLEDAAHK